MRTIKIISDGNPVGTKVVDAETGEPIRGVVAIDFHVDLSGLATAKIEFVNVEFDGIGETTQLGEEYRHFAKKFAETRAQ